MKINKLEKFRFFIAVGLGAFLCLVVIIVWRANNKNLQSTLENKVSDTSQLVAQQFQGALFDNINKLTNLKRRLEITEGDYFEYWNEDAAFIIARDPTFHFVEWIDSTGVIRLVEPMAENKEAIGLDITTLEYRNVNWVQTREDSVFNVTHWLELVQGDFAFLVDAPIFIDKKFHGTITAGIDLTQRFDNIMRILAKYHVTIIDDKGTVFYTFGDSTGTHNLTDFKVRRKLHVNDVNNSEWTITMVPNKQFREANIAGNIFNLVMAIILCCAVPVSFFFMQKSSAAEKSYKEANIKLRSLIDSSPLAIFVTNSEGIVIDFWNNAAEQMFGWKREEVMGNFVPFVKDENLDEFKQLMNRCIEEGELKDQEVVRTKKDGGRRYLFT